MGFPSTVNAGNDVTAGSVTSIVPTLPGSRVNGNLLIAECVVNASGKTIAVTGGGGGWVIGDSANTNISAAWAWRVIDGTESAPTLSWTGAASAQAIVIQWQGVAATPIGNFAQTQSIGASATSTTITSTADNSVVHDIVLTSFAPYTIGPPPFTDRTILTTLAIGGVASILFDLGHINKSGTATDTASYSTPSSSSWVIFSVEVVGTGAGTAGDVRATQAIQEAIETYSTPILEARASQLIQEAMETYSVPILNSLATQICIQVLRTVDVIPPAPSSMVQVQIYE